MGPVWEGGVWGVSWGTATASTYGGAQPRANLQGETFSIPPGTEVAAGKAAAHLP